MTVRLETGSDARGRAMSNVQRFDTAGKLDTSVKVPAAQLEAVLASVHELAETRGLPEAERDDLIAMLTPQPEHVVAA